MKRQIDQLLAEDEKLQRFLTWVDEKARSVDAPGKPAAIRAFYFDLNRDFDLGFSRILNHALNRDLDGDRALDRALNRDLDGDLDGDRALDRALDHALDRALDISSPAPSKPQAEAILDLSLNLIFCILSYRILGMNGDSGNNGGKKRGKLGQINYVL